MTTRRQPPPAGCGFIYALSDPLTPCEIRYIGKTENALGTRLSSHIYARHRAEVCHRLNWIKKLVAEGRRPLVWPLEICPLESWAERERFWIAFFRPLGLLTNGTDGGDQGTLTPEIRAKLSAASKGRKMTPLQRAAFDARKEEFVARTVARNKRGWSQATKEKQSALRRGKPMTPAQKAAWEARKPELVARLVARNKQGLSRESIEKSAAKKRGKKWTPEQVAKLKASPGFAEKQVALIERNKQGWSEATRAKQLAIRKGKPMTPAQRAAWEARKPELIARLVARNKLGLSPEAREKQAASMRGKKWSEEQRARWIASGARDKLIARNKAKGNVCHLV